MKIEKFYLFLLACFVAIGAYSQDGQQKMTGDEKSQQQSDAKVKITGQVFDESGEGIPGANVTLKSNPTSGTVTDLDGKFILMASPQKDVLVVSFIGYNTQEFPLKGKTNVTIQLSQNVNELDAVEIVAFGTQKKESVIGSITTLSPKSLRVPSSNMTTALAGQVAGIISYQTSGEPGADDASFFVRGIASFGFNTSPLILIDNIESTSTDLGRLNPDDIESFSIMKDAMATALYGSRGANGVVLVKTKEGERGKTKFDVRIEGSNSRPTSNIELADPVTYMKLHNEAILTRDPSAPVMYSDDKIDRTVPGSGSIIYPTNDWRRQLMKNSTWNGRANMSISGGGNSATYYVSLRYTKDQGLLNVDGKNNFNNNINLQTYQMRANVNINVTKTTQVRVNLSGIFDTYEGPIYSGSDIYKMVMKSNPVLFPAVYPTDEQHKYIKHILFGNSDDGSYLNPYAEMVKGYKEYENTTLLATLGVTQDLNFITKGLKFEGFFNVSRKSYYGQTRQYKPYYYALSSYDFMTEKYSIENINPDSGTEYLDFSPGDKTVNNVMTIETRTSYNQTFGDHSVGGLIVTQYIDSKNPNYKTLQESLPSRNMGVSGRFTYAYSDRYFTEFNFGYNASERFDKKHRWGFFPSVGGGWMISNEPFFQPLSSKITKLKLRASYGLVGNDKIGRVDERFLYLSNVNMNAGGASFGYENKYSRPGVNVSRYANPALGEDAFQRIIKEKHDANIMFLIQQANIRSSELKTAKEFNKEVANVNEAANKKISNIEVSAYASPDGGVSLNTTLAENRENNTTKMLNKDLKKAKIDAPIDAKYTAQDWEGFQELVSKSNIQDKELILRVLSMYQDPAQREQEIKNISSVYKTLADEILPQLRRSRLTLNYEIIGKSDEEIAKLASSNPSELNIEELLYAATLTNDPAKQEAIYTQATKQFPNDYRAYNNLGKLAYQAGNIDKAESYFKKAANVNASPEVNMNLGLVSLMKGDKAAAEAYFGKAAGTKELGESMGNLYIAQGQYERAVNSFGDSKTNSAALAQILAKDYNKAKNTLANVERPDAYTDYLMAVLGARTNNSSMVTSSLKSAVAKDSSLAKKAATDLEFAKYFTNADFMNIVK